jgi:hypothetical protein
VKVPNPIENNKQERSTYKCCNCKPENKPVTPAVMNRMSCPPSAAAAAAAAAARIVVAS